MKVLNNPNATWKKDMKCKECKAELEVEENDLAVGNDAVFYAGETWEPYVYFECPVCHSENRVGKGVPSGLASKLIEKARVRHFKS